MPNWSCALSSAASKVPGTGAVLKRLCLRSSNVSDLPSCQNPRSECGERISACSRLGRLTSNVSVRENWSFWPDAVTCSRQTSAVRQKKGGPGGKNKKRRKAGHLALLAGVRRERE